MSYYDKQQSMRKQPNYKKNLINKKSVLLKEETPVNTAIFQSDGYFLPAVD